MSKSKHEDRHEDIRSVKFTDYAIEKYQYNFDIIKAKRIGIKLSCYKDFWYKLFKCSQKRKF